MSFLSVLKSIGGVFGKVTSVITPLEPVIAAVPVYGPAFDSIFNSVIAVEQLFANLLPTTTPAGTPAATAQAGALKKSVVTAIVNSTAATPIPEATLSTTIDQIVAALNALQAAQAKVSTPAPAA
jgi:tRNA U34 5-methylaminomethyl-2-thiouridine-forming methyltransferase MnmC